MFSSCLLVLLASLFGLAHSQDPVRPYPLPDSFLSSTSILNHSQYVQGLDEPQWYLDNIPFVDFPDPQIQEIYYYRTSVLKRHLVYTHESHGWIFTEFIQPVPWSSKFQTIPDSAPHQIQEARWLRDPSYVKDVIITYTRGGVETLAGVTYTHYLHQSFLEAAQVNGDVDFLAAQLDGMIHMYNLWNSTRDNMTGLYHRTPLSDAQEFSLPGYTVGGPNGGPVEVWNSLDNDFDTIWLGPETYRPSFNGYMIANARSISNVASLVGNESLALVWSDYAGDLYGKMIDLLWNEDIQFWIDVVKDGQIPAVGRQLIGLYPYRFDVGTEDSRLPGIEASLNEDVFVAEWGPTTLEKSNPYFTADKNTTYCCLWNGQSWPFSTCVYLGTLARLARENRSSVATAEFFQQEFSTYTRTHYHQGKPAILEVHYPEMDAWSGYNQNHSEHYLHSTYLDNVFTNLLGIIPSVSETFEMRPLVPSNWTYFAVENLPYHGTLMSILWDADGSHYEGFDHSAGLSIYSNGSLVHSQAGLWPFNATLPESANSSISQLANVTRYVNMLSNPNIYVSPLSFPFANGTDTFFVAGNNMGPAYLPGKANDGLLFYDNPPDNFWSNNQSHTIASWLNFTLPRARTFSAVTIAVYDDSDRNGAIACPEAVRVYASNITVIEGSLNSSTNPTMVAERSPWSSCIGNARNTINLDGEITANTISLYFMDAIHYSVAIAEVEIWVPANTGPRYEAEDGMIGFSQQGRATGTNGTVEEGRVMLMPGGALEIADVRSQLPGSVAGRVNLTVVGYGGDLVVGMNFLQNVTAELPGSGNGNATVEVDMLAGGNVVTMYQMGNDSVWLDAIVVGS